MVEAYESEYERKTRADFRKTVIALLIECSESLVNNICEKTYAKSQF